MRYNLFDLSKIPLPHNELATIAADAWEQANLPDSHIGLCPWNCATGKRAARKTKLKRIVWRSTFRRVQEVRLGLVAEINQMANRRIAA